MKTSSYYLIADGDIELNAGRHTLEMLVSNTGDRPIQVGSHAHFFEVNRALRFSRRPTFGMRLDIPSGTAVRFEPGDSKTVRLVAFGGLQLPCGMSGLADSDIEADNAFIRAVARGFVLEPLQ